MNTPAIPLIVPFSQPQHIYRKCCFGLSFAHQQLSNCCLPFFFIYVVASNTTFPFKKLFHGSYFLRTFLPPALAMYTIIYKGYLVNFLLKRKRFRRTSTLRKIFNTKIFPMKISYRPYPRDLFVSRHSLPVSQKNRHPQIWHPRPNNPRICGTPIPIFLGLRDSTFDFPPENWHPHVNERWQRLKHSRTSTSLA